MLHCSCLLTHLNRKNALSTWSWIIFDTASAGYTTIMITAYYILYFKNVIVQDVHRGDFLWGKMIGISMFLLAIVTPALGAIADQGYLRKKLFLFFSLMCVVFTAALTFVGASQATLCVLFFSLSLIGYEACITFYETFLNSVSTKETVGKISGYSFAFGYMGGIMSILISYPFIARMAEGEWSLAPLWIVVIQFLVFGFPVFLFLRDEPSPEVERKSVSQSVRDGFTSLGHTLADLKRFPDLAKFLVAYLFFYDGIATVISFGGTFAKDTLGFSTKEVFIVFIVSNIIAVPGSFLGGYLTDKIGGRKTVLITLLIWIATLLALAASDSKAMFYVVTCMVGLGLGSTQGAARALYAQFVPKHSEARFFALKGLCGRAGTILGPMMFGTISYLTSNQRLASLSLIFFFVVGFIMVYVVNEQDGKQKALEAA